MAKGQFNLDFEESIILRSRLRRAKDALKSIGKILTSVLDRADGNAFSSTTKDLIRVAKNKTKVLKDDEQWLH